MYIYICALDTCVPIYIQFCAWINIYTQKSLRISACICIYVYVCVYTHTHVSVCMCTYMFTHTHVSVCMYTNMYVCTHDSSSTHFLDGYETCMYVCIMYTYMKARMYVCMHAYIHVSM